MKRLGISILKTMMFKQVRWKLSVKNLFFCLLIFAVFILTGFLISTSGSSLTLGIYVKVHSNLTLMPLDYLPLQFRHHVRHTLIKDKHFTFVENQYDIDRAKKLQTNGLNLTASPNNSSNNDHTLPSASKSSDMLVNNTSDAFDKEEGNKDNLDVDIFGNIMKDGGYLSSEWQRQTRCDRCFEHDFKYEIENDDICKIHTNVSDITLLILILTSHRNKLQRNALRETWLTISKNNTGRVRYAFLLGEVPDTRDSIAKENDQFRDFIQEDFIDSYENLTYKTIMGFKWAATKCAAAKFVMKTDDDMFVNVPNVLKLALNYSDLLQTHIFGACSRIAKPIRNKKSKWFASNNSYPQKYYPGFCSGTGYVTSMNVVNHIYKISPYVPFFHLEDVYVALCIQRIGYSLKGIPGFNTYRPKRLGICSYRTSASLVTVHHMTSVTLRRLWNTNCSYRRPFSMMIPRILVKQN